MLIVTRALPSAKQELPEQRTQLLSNLEPVESLNSPAFHVPAGQILQVTAPNSSVHVPPGHAVQEPTPVKTL